MTNAELTKLAISSFNRIPRVAIPDVVGYDNEFGVYQAEYADGSSVCFTDNQLGEGVRRLTDLDFVRFQICDKHGMSLQTVFIYKRAITDFLLGYPYSLVFLRRGKALRTTSSSLPELSFRSN